MPSMATMSPNTPERRMIVPRFSRLWLVLAAAFLLLPTASRADDWHAHVKELRIGLLGGENTQDRLRKYDGFQNLLREKLGVTIKLFPAADYAGVMQAMAAGQVDVSEFSPSAFAGAWLDCKCVEPLIVPQEADGSVYYVAAMVVRADSGITSIEGMRGHSLAFADPNSASGYLIPRATMKLRGIDMADGAYFSRTGFAGGHEQGIVAVLNRQFDAAVTWTSGQGDIAQGYSRGNLRSMVAKGMLKMSDVRIIWTSGKIPNGPWAMRSALPADLKQAFVALMTDLPASHKDIYDSLEQGVGVGYLPATLDLYKDIIELRESERRGSRG